MLDVSLTLLRSKYGLVPFGINEAMYAVPLGKAVGDACAVLPSSSGEICRCSDIEGTVGTVSHNVDPSALGHRLSLLLEDGIEISWMAGTRPAKGIAFGALCCQRSTPTRPNTADSGTRQSIQ